MKYQVRNEDTGEIIGAYLSEESARKVAYLAKVTNDDGFYVVELVQPADDATVTQADTIADLQAENERLQAELDNAQRALDATSDELVQARAENLRLWEFVNVTLDAAIKGNYKARSHDYDPSLEDYVSIVQLIRKAHDTLTSWEAD